MRQFVNSFRCRIHEHCSVIGASCSVDSLLELFFYCIFYNVDIVGTDNALIQCLFRASQDRITGGELCHIRLPVWHWLVENLPHAFHPMGRNDAEILAAFQFICEHPLFIPKRSSGACNDCKVSTPLPLTLTSLGIGGGLLPDVITRELAQAKCRTCSSHFVVDDLTFPPVLMIELGIVEFRNRQNPAITIPENFTVVDSTYTLTGAVLMRPDHFFCIAKTGNKYCVFDDLKDEVRQFSSFSGAVTGNRGQMEKQHLTTGQVPGIHILIYVKDEHLRSSLTLDYEHFDRTYGPGVDHHVPPAAERESGCFQQSNQQSQTLNGAPPGRPEKPKQKMAAHVIHPEINSQGSASNLDQTSRQPEVKKKASPIYSSHMLTISDYLMRYTGKWCTLQFHGKLIAVLDRENRMFVPCNEIMLLANMTEIKKNGFTFIDSFCSERQMDLEDHFIFDDSSSPTKRKRLFISVECATRFFGTRSQETQQILSRKLKRLNEVKIESPGEFLQWNEQDVTTSTGTLKCSGKTITFRNFDDDMYLSLKDVVEAFELENKVKKSGYGFLDKELKILQLPVDSCFLFNKKTRSDIADKAIIALIKANAFKKSENFGQELLQLLFKEVTVSASMKKQISTPKRKMFQKHVAVKSSPRCSPQKPKVQKTQRSLFKKTSKKKETGTALIKSTLMQLCQTHFKGDSNSFF